MTTKITEIIARDIRFPTSQSLAGSDAMNAAPDYSAAYVILKTDHPRGLEGHGLKSSRVIRFENHVSGRVVGCGIHRVRTRQRLGSRKANIARDNFCNLRRHELKGS